MFSEILWLREQSIKCQWLPPRSLSLATAPYGGARSASGFATAQNRGIQKQALRPRSWSKVLRYTAPLAYNDATGFGPPNAKALSGAAIGTLQKVVQHLTQIDAVVLTTGYGLSLVTANGAGQNNARPPPGATRFQPTALSSAEITGKIRGKVQNDVNVPAFGCPPLPRPGPTELTTARPDPVASKLQKAPRCAQVVINARSLPMDGLKDVERHGG